MIETSRLRLRRPGECDIPSVVAAMNDWSVACWLSRPPFPYGENDAREFLRWSASLDAAGEVGVYMLTEQGCDRPIGCASLEVGGGNGVLGYWLAPPVQGRGYMREAVAAVLVEGAVRLPEVAMAVAIVDPANGRSMGVLRALGFAMAAEEERQTPTRRGSMRQLRFERPMML